jgi:perosamine synthetase
MYPRGTPDIRWYDLWRGLIDSLWPVEGAQFVRKAEEGFGAPNALACLSVRSGFDLALQALALPPGSEILVSAVTIPDMLRIIAAHGLVAVPVDIDPQTLAVEESSLLKVLTPRTRAVLIAHLFGSRMPMGAIGRFCHERGLTLFEDCAQAYCGDGYAGHPASTMSMFSFGPIKTATALGGAVLVVNDNALHARMRTIQAGYRAQSPRSYAQRIVLFMLLKLLANPTIFSIFVALCRWRGVDPDGLISKATRGFPGADLLAKIRQRPCGPLLRMLARRLGQPAQVTIARRVGQAQTIYRGLPKGAYPGAQAAFHSHWVIPVLAQEPDRVVQVLKASGFDATRTASSLCLVPAPVGFPVAYKARQLLTQILYVPSYPLQGRAMLSMVQLLRDLFRQQHGANSLPQAHEQGPSPGHGQLDEVQGWQGQESEPGSADAVARRGR